MSVGDPLSADIQTKKCIVSVLQPSLVASTSCFQCKSRICQLATLFKVLRASTSSGSLLWRLKQLVASTIPQQLAAVWWQCGWTMEVDTTELLCHTQRGGQHAQQLLWRWRDSIAREWKLGAGRLLAITPDANNQLLMLHHATCCSSQVQVAHYLQPSLMPTINNHMVGGRIKRRWWSTQSLANTASLLLPTYNSITKM